MAATSREFERVLVQAPNWVGDCVMATPALRCIRRALPRARVSVLLRPYLAKLLDGAPWFDELLPYEPAGADRGVRGFVRTIRGLRSPRFDLAILLTNSFRTAWVARLSGARVRVGYDLQGRGFLLTHAPRPAMEGRRRVPKPMPEYYLDLLEGFGFERGDDRLELFVPEACGREGAELLARWGVGEGDRLVVFNPGASFGASKLWNPAYFSAVGDALARRRGAKILVVFGPGEADLARTIRSGMKATDAVVDPEGTMLPLDLLKPILARCDLLVTTDTGPRHVAVAFDRPVVVVMGPTDPRYSATNLQRTTVLREEVECAPCHLKICPIDHRCMERLTPERVLRACEAALPA